MNDEKNNIRVLLIEDNIGFAYFVKDMLTRSIDGFEVLSASTLRDGLRIIVREQIDIILLDLGLPDSMRYETFSRIRARYEYGPIIILTVLDDDEVALKAMRHGAQDYLVKDKLDRNLLMRSIRYAIERAHAESKLRRLSGTLLRMQDEERRRIARELHDTTAQNFTALVLNLAALEAEASALSPRMRSILRESHKLAEEGAKEIRTISYLLHPPLLDELGLAGAIRDYADGFSRRSGIRVDLEISPQLGRLPTDMETAVFRILQECLSNINRHSGSSTASILLNLENDKLILNVTDAGHGFKSADSTGVSGGKVHFGVGIVGMQERVRQLGGQMNIHSDSDGTRITVALPVCRDVTEPIS